MALLSLLSLFLLILSRTQLSPSIQKAGSSLYRVGSGIINLVVYGIKPQRPEREGGRTNGDDDLLEAICYVFQCW